MHFQLIYKDITKNRLFEINKLNNFRKALMDFLHYSKMHISLRLSLLFFCFEKK